MSGIKVKTAHDGIVLTLVLGGVVTAGAMVLMRSLLVNELRRAPAKGVIVDMTRAVQVLTDEQWRQVANDAAGAPWSGMSVAYVVSPPCEAQTDMYCDLIARHGFVSATFTDHVSARRWIAEECDCSQ
jgi:hypothetical protein